MESRELRWYHGSRCRKLPTFSVVFRGLQTYICVQFFCSCSLPIVAVSLKTSKPDTHVCYVHSLCRPGFADLSAPRDLRDKGRWLHWRRPSQAVATRMTRKLSCVLCSPQGSIVTVPLRNQLPLRNQTQSNQKHHTMLLHPNSILSVYLDPSGFFS